MYYAGLPANGSPNGMTQEKAGIYVPAAGGYAQPSAYPPSQAALPPGLAHATPRFSAAPQAYAVVSSPNHAGYSTISPAYSSLPYSSLAGITTTSPAYISTGQYPGMSYQTALGPRTVAGAAPSPYPVQAGAPLIAAAGYSPMTGAIPAQHAARSYPVGAVAAYPPGYPLPSPGTGPMPYHGAATFGPPY